MVLGNDTVIVISPKQVRVTLQLLNEGKMYREYSDSLFKQKQKQELYILSLRSLNNLKTEKNRLLEANLSKYDSIVQSKEKRIDLLNKSIKSEQSKKTKSFLMGTGFGLVIAAIIKIIIN